MEVELSRVRMVGGGWSVEWTSCPVVKVSFRTGSLSEPKHRNEVEDDKHTWTRSKNCVPAQRSRQFFRIMTISDDPPDPKYYTQTLNRVSDNVSFWVIYFR